MHIKMIDGQPIKYNIKNIRKDHPNTSFPDALTDELLESYDVHTLLPVHSPSVQDGYQKAVEGTPEFVDGAWRQCWQVVQTTPEEVATWQASQASQVEAKIDALWCATDAYIAQYISGVAIGILTLGVAQMKPKALQVTAWTQAIWTEYYKRKAAVTATSVDDHDYTAFGPIPFSIQELKEEAGL